MADVVDKTTRSRMMSGIRAKNTRPEVFIRKGLHALGFRFRLHAKEIPGKPDIVFPKYKALIIVHGCFWHGHDCRYFKFPKSNPQFWRDKIEANKARDQRNIADQRSCGWRTLIIWECAVRSSVKETKELDVLALAATWLAVGSGNVEINERGMLEDPAKLCYMSGSG